MSMLRHGSDHQGSSEVIGNGAPAPGAPAVAPDTAPGASMWKVRLSSSRLFELT